MYILNIARAIKKMLVNKIRDFIFENYYKRTRCSKEDSYYSVKYLKKRIYCYLQTNSYKKYLIFVMLKNTISNILERKTQTQ